MDGEFGYINISSVYWSDGTVNITVVTGNPDKPTKTTLQYSYEDAVLLANKILTEANNRKLQTKIDKENRKYYEKIDFLYDYIMNGTLPEGAEEPYITPIKGIIMKNWQTGEEKTMG